MSINTLQIKRETLETICLSDSLARTLYLSADSLDLKLCDSIVTLHAVNARLGHQSQTRRHYGHTAQHHDTLTKQQCQSENEAVQTQTGIIATTSNGRSNPFPWLLAAALIIIDCCLLLRSKRRKCRKR